MKNVKSSSLKEPVLFNAEIWDQMQFFFKEYNDHQIHGVIYFENFLNRDLIKKAALLSIDLVPILGSKFVINRFHPHWEKLDEIKLSDIISFIDSHNTEEEIQRFITKVINELTGPQIMVRVISSSKKDTLCIVMNHMICDGAGFREYLYLLSEIYTSLENGTYNDYKYIDGSRSPKQIYKQFNPKERIKISLLLNKATKDKNSIRFPLSKEQANNTPHVFIYKLSEKRFNLLKKYSEEHLVTINDIILAAYYRVLYKIIDIKPSDSLTIPCMVDLRRYIPDKKAKGICNLTSMIMCNIGSDLGKDFDETVKKVSKEMNKNKDGFPGLYGLSSLNLLFKLVPFKAAKKLISKHYGNPMIGMTNIGIINSDKLVFGKTRVEDSFITGSIKHPPYFQLALTSFKNSITFSVNLYCSKDVDGKLINEFYSLLDKELQIG